MISLQKRLFKMAQVTLHKMPANEVTEEAGKLLVKSLKETYYKLSKEDKIKFMEEMEQYE